MNAKLKIGTILAGAALAVSTLAGAASADSGNMITNGDLRPTTAGWQMVGFHGTLNSVPGIGGKLTNTALSGSEITVWAKQCVKTENLREYHMVAESRVPQNQDREGHGSIKLAFFPGETCAGVSVDSMTSLPLPTTGSFQQTSHAFIRNNTKQARSVSVMLMVTKYKAADSDDKHEPFAVLFRGLRMVGWGEPMPQPGATLTDCVAPAGCDDDGDLPELPPAQCIGKGCFDNDDDLPVPVPPTGDAPTLQPIEPAAPVEPEAPVEPAAPVEPGVPAPAQPDSDEFPSDDDSGDDASAEVPAGEAPSHDSPAGSPSQPSTTNNPTSNPGSNNGGAPAKPSLEPQGPGPINAATPTPGAPATGGDSTSDPADGLTNGPGDSSEVARSEKGDPMPVFAAAAMASALGFIGLAMVFKRRRRS